MKITRLFIVLLMLTSCGSSSDTPTAEEAAQLNDAANMLNEAPANLDSVDDSGIGSANGVANETL